jgi:predicted regulator of Ras-like GTPase activity (Roadblock/LC7/MglB family)
MANVKDTLQALQAIDGVLGSCIVDYTSGMALGHEGGGVDLELAAAGNSEVVKAKMRTMKSLGIEGQIEDILITLDDQLHIIRPSVKNAGIFIYVVLDKDKANLALARRNVVDAESAFEKV